MNIWKAIIASIVLASLLWASGIAPQAYTLIQQAAANLTRRTTLNFTGTGVSCVDNAGASRTDCTINSTTSLAFSGLTSGTNTTATMTVGTGATLNRSGTGTIDASLVLGLTPQGWQKVTVGFASLTNAGLTQTINLLSTSSRTKVCGVAVKHTAAFTGGTVSAMTVSVGDAAGSATTYTATFNIFQAPGNTVFQDTVEMLSATYAASTIQAFFTATGGNLNTLAAGSVDFDICTVVLP